MSDMSMLGVSNSFRAAFTRAVTMCFPRCHFEYQLELSLELAYGAPSHRSAVSRCKHFVWAHAYHIDLIFYVAYFGSMMRNSLSFIWKQASERVLMRPIKAIVFWPHLSKKSFRIFFDVWWSCAWRKPLFVIFLRMTLFYYRHLIKHFFRCFKTVLKVRLMQSVDSCRQERFPYNILLTQHSMLDRHLDFLYVDRWFYAIFFWGFFNMSSENLCNEDFSSEFTRIPASFVQS